MIVARYSAAHVELMAQVSIMEMRRGFNMQASVTVLSSCYPVKAGARNLGTLDNLVIIARFFHLFEPVLLTSTNQIS